MTRVLLRRAVMNPNTVGLPETNKTGSDVLVHELGHNLGLWYTFYTRQNPALLIQFRRGSPRARSRGRTERHRPIWMVATCQSGMSSTGFPSGGAKAPATRTPRTTSSLVASRATCAPTPRPRLWTTNVRIRRREAAISHRLAVPGRTLRSGITWRSLPHPPALCSHQPQSAAAPVLPVCLGQMLGGDATAGTLATRA